MSYPAISRENLKAELKRCLNVLIPTLDETKAETLKEIIGEEMICGFRWDEYSQHQQRLFGRLVRELVMYAEIELKKVGYKGTSVVYMRADSPLI